MGQLLGHVPLDRAAKADDEYRRLLLEVSPGGQVMDQDPVELGQALELELLHDLGGAELSSAQTGAELLLLTPGDLVADQQRQEVQGINAEVQVQHSLQVPALADVEIDQTGRVVVAHTVEMGLEPNARCL